MVINEARTRIGLGENALHGVVRRVSEGRRGRGGVREGKASSTQVKVVATETLVTQPCEVVLHTQVTTHSCVQR